MGKTTSGQSTSDNWHDWVGIYNKVFNMYNNKTGAKPYDLTQLYKQVTDKQPDPVAEALDSLEKYYRRIETFLADARSGTTDREDLADEVDELCSPLMLDGYPKTVNLVLRALASIAEKANAYISSSSSSSSKLSSEESGVLKDVLTTIKSISENVKRDFVAEIRGDWDAYVFARRRSLRAIGGIQDMPPLPPLPKPPVTG
jgi:hypothetical protein